MKWLICTSLLLLSLGAAAHGQRPSEVVKWTAITTKETPASASVALSAAINDGWHVYALSQPLGGPTPLKISMPAGSPFVLEAPVPETQVTRHFDPNFNMETVYYLRNVSFKITLKKAATVHAEAVPIDVRFQACSGKLCLPPYTTHLSVNIKRK